MFTNLTALDWTEVVIEPRQHFLNHVLKIGRRVPGIKNHVTLVLRRCTQQTHQWLLIRLQWDDVIVVAGN